MTFRIVFWDVLPCKIIVDRRFRDGVSGNLHAPATLYPRRKDPPVPTGQEAGWSPFPVWTQKAVPLHAMEALGGEEV
jgi:hypothetical protein